MNQVVSSSSKIPPKLVFVVRLTWIIIALFQVTVFFITLPGELAKDDKFTVNNFSGDSWTQEQIDTSARELGITTGFLDNLNKVLNSSLQVALLYYAVGFLIFFKKSDDWIAVSISLSFVIFLNSAGLLQNKFPIFGVIADLTDIFNSALLFIVFMIFPDGKFIPNWTKWAALYTAGVQVWRWFSPQAYSMYFPVLGLPTLFSIVYAQVYRYRRIASQTQRLQIKWVVFINGLGFGLLGLVFLSYAIFTPLTKPGPAGLAGTLIGGLIWTLFMILLPLSFAIAILRSRLWDIDVIIRKTLVYTLLTGLLGLTYFGVVALLQGVVTDRGQLPPAIIVATTLAIYVLFNPLRRRIQDFIDRRFYRQKYDSEKALGEFAAAARSETDLAQLANELTGTVQETMQPVQVGLWLQQSKRIEKT